MTNYGWPDNSPPGANIAENNGTPVGPKMHTKATEGAGTYDDPITVATEYKASQNGATVAAGTIVYNPITQKYYVVEDGCVECTADFKCQYDDSEDAGTPGDPASGCKMDTYFHLDFWMGPNTSSVWSAGGATLVNASQNCEGLSTIGDTYNVNYAIDGGPGYGTTDGTVIINPPPGLPVRSGTLFDSMGNCWTNRQVLPIDMVCH
jgi:hypothetical protein